MSVTIEHRCCREFQDRIEISKMSSDSDDQYCITLYDGKSESMIFLRQEDFIQLAYEMVALVNLEDSLARERKLIERLTGERKV